MSNQKTTVKTKAADRLTELREARNKLAVAISKASKSHSAEDRKEVDAAREAVEAVEARYRRAQLALMEKQCEKQKNYKRSSAWKLPFGRR